MSDGDGNEKFVIEARAERMRILSGNGAVRRGESDRLEVGFGEVPRRPHVERRRGGPGALEAGRLHADRRQPDDAGGGHLETNVVGKATLKAKSDTTLLAGTVVDTQQGAILVAAGMSDDMMLGGGVRVTAGLDLWLSGLIGMEEKIGTAMADLALIEVGSTTFEREYGPGVHAYLLGRFSGALKTTMATGFRALCKVTTAVRNKTPGGGGYDPPTTPTGAPLPPPALASGAATGADPGCAAGQDDGAFGPAEDDRQGVQGGGRHEAGRGGGGGGAGPAAAVDEARRGQGRGGGGVGPRRGGRRTRRTWRRCGACGRPRGRRTSTAATTCCGRFSTTRTGRSSRSSTWTTTSGGRATWTRIR